MGMEQFFPNYNTSAFAPMGATYTDWLQGALGGGAVTSPIAQQYAQSFAPWAQLQYMASGAIPPNIDAGTYAGNPFGSYLSGMTTPAQGEGTPTFQMAAPVGAGQTGWTGIAQNVMNALAADPTGATQDQLRLQERFGTGEQAGARQAMLAAAPIVSNTPFALRGETQNILNRLYDRWLVRNQDQTGAGYLQQAMAMADPVGDAAALRDPSSLWGRFGVGT